MDIEERLLTGRRDDYGCVTIKEHVLMEAADEIKRLRADKDVIRSQERNAAYEADIAQLQAENEQLRAALKQLVADYEDVPDPTDSDGQEVFARARAALARSDRD